MNTKPHRNIAAIVCLLFFASLAFAQEPVKKPQTLITESKLVIGNLKINERKVIKFSGRAIYKITEGRSDSSLLGILTYNLSNQSRVQIARTLGQKLAQIPESISQQEVSTNFQKGTECPLIRLEFAPISFKLNDQQIQLDGFTLEIKETEQHVSKILCTLARRANGFALGRGPLRRFNELLHDEEEDK